MVGVGVGDAVDPPDTWGDEGRFGGEVDRDVTEVGAGGVADGEFADDRDRVLVEREVDVPTVVQTTSTSFIVSLETVLGDAPDRCAR